MNLLFKPQADGRSHDRRHSFVTAENQRNGLKSRQKRRIIYGGNDSKLSRLVLFTKGGRLHFRGPSGSLSTRPVSQLFTLLR